MTRKDSAVSLDATESIQATFTLEDKGQLESATSAALRLPMLKPKHSIEKMIKLF